MNATEGPYTAPKTWQRAGEHPDAKRPFPEVLSEHMERAGIESLEELWERFTKTEENLQRWRFMRHSTGTLPAWDARYIRGVCEALGYERESEEAWRLALSYANDWQHRVQLSRWTARRAEPGG